MYSVSCLQVTPYLLSLYGVVLSYLLVLVLIWGSLLCFLSGLGSFGEYRGPIRCHSDKTVGPIWPTLTILVYCRVDVSVRIYNVLSKPRSKHLRTAAWCGRIVHQDIMHFLVLGAHGARKRGSMAVDPPFWGGGRVGSVDSKIRRYVCRYST